MVQLLHADGEEPLLTEVYDFAPHSGPVTAFAASSRDKGFATADSSGKLQLHYGTTGQTLLALQLMNAEHEAVFVFVA